MGYRCSAIVENEGRLFVALCPELDVASQGKIIDSALKNLKEAVALFLETASPKELRCHLSSRPLITTLEVTV